MVISVILTTYDRLSLSIRALESIQQQSYESLEIIVVEDASNSGIEDWIKNNGDKDIKYIKHTENKGLAAARNTGLKLSSGKYVGYLDDDDVWLPNHVEKKVQLLNRMEASKRQEVGIIYCGTEKELPNGKKTFKSPFQSGLMRSAFIRTGEPQTFSSTFLFKKDALLEVGGFDETLPSSIDHDIWMAIANKGYHVRAVNKVLVKTSGDMGNRMIHNVEKRTTGVKMFVKKWDPIFKEWLGEKAGRAYGYRYYARVIGRLAAQLFASAQFSSFFKVAANILKHSERQKFYSVYILSRYCLSYTIRRLGLR